MCLQAGWNPLLNLFSATRARRCVAVGDGLRGQPSPMLATLPFDCRPVGWNYSVSYPTYDVRFSKPGLRVNRCGYGFVTDFKSSPVKFDEAMEPLRAVGQHHQRQGHRPIMVDVGANVGQSMLPLLSLGWAAVAFEPSPRNLQVIRTNLETNGFTDQVVLFEGVASDTSTNLTLHVPTNGREDNNALSKSATIHQRASKAVVVRSETVDNFFALRSDIQARDVHYIKIDTQGHEVEVLRGMRTVLERAHRHVIVRAECDPWLLATQGHTRNDLLQAANEMGLSLWCSGTCVRKFEPDRCTKDKCTKISLPICSDVMLYRNKSCEG